MPISPDILFFTVEIIGTIAFAISGAMTAIERRLDLFGVLFLGATTAIGGGIFRDILLGQIPPQAFLNYVYMLTAVITAGVIFLLNFINSRRDTPLPFFSTELPNFFDAAGLGIFSVIGVQNTINAGFGDNSFFCIFLGMLTGVGGGMLRDMMSRTTPAVLRKHIYALASIAGSICYYYLHALHDGAAILGTTVLVVVIRLLASHYKWTLPRIPLPDAPQN